MKRWQKYGIGLTTLALVAGLGMYQCSKKPAEITPSAHNQSVAQSDSERASLDSYKKGLEELANQTSDLAIRLEEAKAIIGEYEANNQLWSPRNTTKNRQTPVSTTQPTQLNNYLASDKFTAEIVQPFVTDFAQMYNNVFSAYVQTVMSTEGQEKVAELRFSQRINPRNMQKLSGLGAIIREAGKEARREGLLTGEYEPKNFSVEGYQNLALAPATDDLGTTTLSMQQKGALWTGLAAKLGITTDELNTSIALMTLYAKNQNAVNNAKNHGGNSK